MIFNINTLLDKILFTFGTLNPKYCRELDDPRIDTYYISINPNNYIVLYGSCGDCDSIYIYNNKKIKYDIMTTEGIDKFVNKWDESIDDIYNRNIIFKLELNTFNRNINELILLLKNVVNNKIIKF